MLRILLFLATNIAVMVVLTIAVKVLGLEEALAAQGSGIDLSALLVMAGIIGMGGSLISLLISKWSAKRLMSLHVIKQPANTREAWLLDTVAKLARDAGIGMPEVAIFDSPAPNAFATGASRDQALVAVSTDLLERMREGEVEAVLGHEVTHVANGDMVTLALIQGVVNTFVIFLSRVVGHVIDRMVLRNEHGHGPGFWITTIVAELVLGVLASMIVMWFSRWREFRADAGGARLAGRDKMIAALRRLGSAVDQEPLPDQFQAFGITGGRGLMRLFMSHPPLEERIEALRRNYS